MLFTDMGEYVPDIDSTDYSAYASSCPSLQPEQNETVIGSNLFRENATHEIGLGHVTGTFAGYANEGSFRQHGTSGGMVSWVLAELMRKDIIDSVVHVKEVEGANTEGPFYEYGKSTTISEVKQNSKTKYHVVELSKILREIKESDDRVAVVGVPCMIKSLRRLARLDKDIKKRVVFTISLVCGHLKSVNWSRSLSWGAGIHPNQMKNIQYRIKGESVPARAYVCQIETQDGTQKILDTANIVGGKYNVGSLMLPACDYCDDVVGETADLTIGDAWLPKYDVDNRGTNLLITRSNEARNLLISAMRENRIYLDNITADEARSSQSGGFRQRGEGLSHRLQLALDIGKKVPEKRIRPGEFKLTALRKEVYKRRSIVSRDSRIAFKEAIEKNDYSIFVSRMKRQLVILRHLEFATSFPRLFINKFNRAIRGIALRMGRA